MKHLIYFDFKTFDGEAILVEDEIALYLPYRYYALIFYHNDRNGNGDATMRIFGENHDVAKIELNGWSIKPVIDYRYDWIGNYATLIVTDPKGYVFEMKKDVDRRKHVKDKPLALVPFITLKELQTFNSGLEYELKLENERLEKMVVNLTKEIDSLKKASKETQS